jgi:hypothetical protein
MPAVSIPEATERIARAVSKADPSLLAELNAELYPEKPAAAPPAAGEFVRLVRGGLEPEEIVALWNILFPDDRGVYYNEETNAIHFNEQMVGYAD